MRKIVVTLIAAIMVFVILVQPEVRAASAIKIYINGIVLETDQPPLLDGGYTFVPFRGILEALDAQISWNSHTQTVTASKKGTTVVLKIGARTATINNQTVTLQAPARVVNGRTLAPVRFVSEALGESVVWDSRSQSVFVTTSAVKEVGAASSVKTETVSQFGDGRDLQVSFTPPSDQSNVNSYRALIVKASNASSFNLAKAQSVNAANYTTIPTYDAYRATNLTTGTRDTDGALLKANQAYRVFILTVGNDIYALSSPSSSVTLNESIPVDTATNVRISDISDYGDGRDISVSFTKAKSDSNISGYRVMIVKSKDAASFNLTLANAVPSTYYNTISKTSATSLSTSFSSNSRDTSGELIQNGVAYTAYVLSISNNPGKASNSLSASSGSITLGGYSTESPLIIYVSDVENYGDGRDIQINYLKATNDNNVNSYRIFVVREADYKSFNLNEANKVSSGRYQDITKASYNFTQVLPSNIKDVKGNAITNGVTYRIFIMSVMNRNSISSNVLSAPSEAITLANSGVTAISNLTVNDEGDYNNGRDLRVSFTKASMEGNLNHYRILVVKEAHANSFNLVTANAVTNQNNYTRVPLTGGNISQTLTASTRDINGDLIQNGITYRIFVLSVGGGTSNGLNALSASSPSITLANSTVVPVTDVAVSDVGDHNNGQDLQISFTKSANENQISHYRIFVVKDTNAASFNLATANAITNNSYYTNVSKTGANIVQLLPTGALDVNGLTIQNGISYRVFVLSVANDNMSNALSSSSGSITLTSTAPPAVPAPVVQSITAEQVGTISDLITVHFTRPANENGIDHYAVLLVPESAGVLTEADAISYQTTGRYSRGEKGVNSTTLTSASVDINGAPIVFNVQYQIYVLSVADGVNANQSTLSSLLTSVKLTQ